MKTKLNIVSRFGIASLMNRATTVVRRFIGDWLTSPNELGNYIMIVVRGFIGIWQRPDKSGNYIGPCSPPIHRQVAETHVVRRFIGIASPINRAITAFGAILLFCAILIAFTAPVTYTAEEFERDQVSTNPGVNIFGFVGYGVGATAQSFKPGFDYNGKFRTALYLKRMAGETASLSVEIKEDGGGKPAATAPLGWFTIPPGDLIDGLETLYQIEWQMIAGGLKKDTTYWIVVNQSTDGPGWFWNMSGNDSGVYDRGRLSTTGDGINWSSGVNNDCYFITSAVRTQAKFEDPYFGTVTLKDIGCATRQALMDVITPWKQTLTDVALAIGEVAEFINPNNSKEFYAVKLLGIFGDALNPCKQVRLSVTHDYGIKVSVSTTNGAGAAVPEALVDIDYDDTAIIDWWGEYNIPAGNIEVGAKETAAPVFDTGDGNNVKTDPRGYARFNLPHREAGIFNKQWGVRAGKYGVNDGWTARQVFGIMDGYRRLSFALTATTFWSLDPAGTTPITQANDGDLVYMFANLGSAFEGTIATFKVYEVDDYLIYKNYEEVLPPITATVKDGIAAAAWQAKWIIDGWGLDEPDEYAFKVTVDGNTKESSILNVSKVPQPLFDKVIWSSTPDGLNPVAASTVAQTVYAYVEVRGVKAGDEVIFNIEENDYLFNEGVEVKTHTIQSADISGQSAKFSVSWDVKAVPPDVEDLANILDPLGMEFIFRATVKGFSSDDSEELIVPGFYETVLSVKDKTAITDATINLSCNLSKKYWSILDAGYLNEGVNCETIKWYIDTNKDGDYLDAGESLGTSATAGDWPQRGFANMSFTATGLATGSYTIKCVFDGDSVPTQCNLNGRYLASEGTGILTVDSDYAAEIISVVPSGFAANTKKNTVTVTVKNIGKTADLKIDPDDPPSGWAIEAKDPNIGIDFDEKTIDGVASGDTVTFTYYITPPATSKAEPEIEKITWRLYHDVPFGLLTKDILLDVYEQKIYLVSEFPAPELISPADGSIVTKPVILEWDHPWKNKPAGDTQYIDSYSVNLFEKYPYGWKLNIPADSSVRAGVDETVSHSGAKSLKTYSPFASASNVGTWVFDNVIEVEPNAQYTFGAYIKTDGYSGGASFNLILYDSIDGNQVSSLKFDIPAGDRGWTQLNTLITGTTFTTPANVKYIGLLYFIFADGAGTVWFDDLEMTKGGKLSKVYPDTKITSGPDGITSEKNVTFAFEGSDSDGEVTHFAYLLRGPDYTSETFTEIVATKNGNVYTGSVSFTNLKDGLYGFIVKAKDNDTPANFDLTPSKVNFSVSYVDPAANLVPNSGFKVGPTPWTVVKIPNSNTEGIWDDTVYHGASPDGSLKLRMLDENSPIEWNLTQNMNIDPDSIYRMELWVKKSASADGKFYMQIEVQDLGNSPVGKFVLSIPTGDSDWAHYVKAFKTQSNAHHISSISLKAQGSGVIWFDDVSVQKIAIPADGIKMPVTYITSPATDDTVIPVGTVIACKFSSGNDDVIQSYMYSLDKAISDDDWFPVTEASNPAASISGLLEGKHILYVAAVNIEGFDTRPAATRSFTVNIAPEVSITSGPLGNITSGNVTFEWNGTDSPGDTLTYSYKLTGETENSDWSEWMPIKTKSYTNLSGAKTFYVKAKDNAGAESNTVPGSSFTVNNPPVITSVTLNPNTTTISEGASLTFTPQASDPDGNVINYVWTLDGETQSNNAIWTYVPGFDDNGTHTAKLFVSDNYSIVERAWTITVNNANSSPNIISYSPITPPDPEVVLGYPLAFSVTASDADGDSLTYLWELDGVTKSTNSSWTYTPINLNEIGTHAVTLTVSDGSAGASQNWTVIVIKNEPPAIISYSPPLSPNPGVAVNSGSIAFSVTAFDAESMPLTYSWKLDGAQVSTDTLWAYAPSSFEVGVHAVDVSVNDGVLETGLSWQVTVVLNSQELALTQRTVTSYYKFNTQFQLVGAKIYLAWLEYDDNDNAQIWTAEMNTDGSGWLAVKRTDTPFKKVDLQLETDGTKVYLVWSQKTLFVIDPTTDFYQIWTGEVAVGDADNTTWKSAQRTTDGQYKFEPQLQVVGSAIYYVWRRYWYSSGYYEIWTAKMNTDGTGWAETQRTTGDSTTIPFEKYSPQFQIVGSKIYYVWTDYDYRQASITHQISTAEMNLDGTGWATAQRTSNTSRKYTPQLQIDGAKIYYVWTEHDGNNNQIWTAEMNLDGTGWIATQRTINATDKYTPQLQMLNSEIYLVFTEYDGAGVQIWTAKPGSYLYSSLNFIETFGLSGSVMYDIYRGSANTLTNISWNGAEDGFVTDIGVRVRTASTKAGLSSAQWSPYYGSNGSKSDFTTSISTDKWLQVEVDLETDNVAQMVALDDLTLTDDALLTTAPHNPSPMDLENYVHLHKELSWNAGSLEPSETVTYDVYFEANNPNPKLVGSGLSSAIFDPGTLNATTTYYWQIVAKYSFGLTLKGPVWKFTTTDLEGDLKYNNLLGKVVLTFDSGKPMTSWDKISFLGAESPNNSDIKFRMRTASSKGALWSAAWTPALYLGDNSGTKLFTSTDYTLSDNRWIQIEVILERISQSYSIELDSMTIEYTPKDLPGSGIATFVVDSGKNATKWNSIKWNAATATGEDGTNTDIKARVRTADTETNLSLAAWSTYYSEDADSEGTAISISPQNNRYIQIEVKFETIDALTYQPRLDDLTVDYAPDVTVEPAAGIAVLTFDSGYTLTKWDSISFSGLEDGSITDITLRIRGASTEERLAYAAWTELGANAIKNLFTSGTDFTITPCRWIQIKVELGTKDIGHYVPTLDSVAVDYTRAGIPGSGIATFVVDSGKNATKWNSIKWNAATATGEDGTNTDIKARVRTADTETNLSLAAWSTYYSEDTDSEGTAISISPRNNRYLQIEVKLETTDAITYQPRLEDVTLDYTLGEAGGLQVGTATLTFDSGKNITQWDSVSFAGAEDGVNYDMKIRMRTASSQEAFNYEPWTDWLGAGNAMKSFTSGTDFTLVNWRWIQIEAALDTTDSFNYTPKLDSVDVSYTAKDHSANGLATITFDSGKNATRWNSIAFNGAEDGTNADIKVRVRTDDTWSGWIGLGDMNKSAAITEPINQWLQIQVALSTVDSLNYPDVKLDDLTVDYTPVHVAVPDSGTATLTFDAGNTAPGWNSITFTGVEDGANTDIKIRVRTDNTWSNWVGLGTNDAGTTFTISEPATQWIQIQTALSTIDSITYPNVKLDDLTLDYGVSAKSAMALTGNNPPNAPVLVYPSNGAANQGVNVDLMWTGGDPDAGDSVTYDVYLEANDFTPAKLVSDNQTQTTFTKGILSYGATYYWQIIAIDNNGVSTAGPVWKFTTVNLGSATAVGILGDVDADEVISLADGDMISKYTAGSIILTPEQIIRADVNSDGNVAVSDAAMISQYANLTTQCDFNDDYIIDSADETLLNPHLGETPLSPAWDAKYDLNGDDTVDIMDVNILTARLAMRYIAASSGFSGNYGDMSNVFGHYDADSDNIIGNSEHTTALGDFGNGLLSQAETDYLTYMFGKNVSLIKIVKGISVNSIPFYGDAYDAARFQTLFLQSEISKAGIIDRIFLQKYNSNAGRFSNFTVYLSHSSASSLSAVFGDNYKAGEAPAKAMDKPSVFLSGSDKGWLCFDLDDNFSYNNQDSLLFEIRWSGDGAVAVPVYGNGGFDNTQLFAPSDIAATGITNPVSYNLMLEIK